MNIQGLDIEMVETYKYLGVHLNNKLDCSHLHRHYTRIFYAVVCWGGGSTERDRKRLNKLVRRAASVLDCSLDSIEDVSQADIYHGRPLSPPA